ncbi:MAG: triphosphoribosyl-dephospho-CoA synthase [archaeon]
MANFGTEELERELGGAFAIFSVSPSDQEKIRARLKEIREVDEETYRHSVRDGLKASEIASYLNLDPKPALISGSLHDFGKTKVPEALLRKKSGFSEEDYAVMEGHVLAGYEALKVDFPFSAEILLRHHIFQERGYPKSLPKPSKPFSEGTLATIGFYSRLLALADFYDAITTRKNDMFGGALSKADAKAIFLAKSPDQKRLINALYNNSVFDSGEKADSGKEGIYPLAFGRAAETRQPREIRRLVTLASALEPLSDKPGLTTRHSDISRHLKLPYFVASAINIGDAFEDLAESLAGGTQPDEIYSHALTAQLEAVRNRDGGRVIQGEIELFLPIVAAQILYDRDRTLSVDELLGKAVEVLKATGEVDVKNLWEMKAAANALSEYARTVPEHPEAKSVYDYYLFDLGSSEGKPTSVAHNGEFVRGFPAVRKAYELISGSGKKDFNKRVEEAYAQIRLETPEVSPGFTADCIAAGIYLALSQNPREKLIK